MHNKIIIISGPSAVGKSRVINQICKMNSDFEFLVSYTTRERRRDERDGEDYYFITNTVFERMNSSNKFFEVSRNDFGNYGISYESISKILLTNKNIITDCNLEGYLKFKKEYGERCVGIFIRPTSLGELYSQLKKRGVSRGIMNSNDLHRRWENSLDVMKTVDLYDFALINVNVVETAETIVKRIREW